MSYYDRQESKIAIMEVLAEKGWKIYGYKPDQSDSMTDYWSPAHWDGIAEKNGFVLLVDQYDTHYSGYKKTKKGFSADYEKIKKLQATIEDEAATKSEKEACRAKIAKLKQKEKESTIIVEQYPEFKHANPARSSWHIEKDGQIIAKGNGVFSIYDSNDQEGTRKRAIAFVERIEKKIQGMDQLQAVKKEVKKKAIKPVEITDRKTLKVGDVLSFSYHGHYWLVIDVNEKTFTYELLGSEKRGYQRLKNGKRYYDLMKNFEKNLENGSIKLYQLQEVEEITYKTVYKKVQRKGQEENLLAGESKDGTTEQTEQQEKAPVAQQTEKEVENQQEAVTVTYQLNKEKNGVELYFSGKPSEEVRNVLKARGFRWSRNKKCWYAKQSEEAISLAKQLAGENDTQTSEQTENDYNSHLTAAQKETLSKRLNKENMKPLRLFKKDGLVLLECINLNLPKENQKPFYFAYFENGQETGKGYEYPLDGFELIHTFKQPINPITATIEYPEIDINDNDQYIIDQSLIDREYSANWIFRSQKRDHNKEIQELFNHYTEKTKEVIQTTENEYYIFKLKQALQRFKKHYHQTYTKYLTAKADNPSWAVTGRAGRNRRKDQKAQDRENRYMLEVVDLPKQFEKQLNKYKDKIRKDEKEALKKRIEQAKITITFETQTKEFTYMGLKEKKRVYTYQNYWICKLWGCYRIFKDGKEIYSMRTIDKLEDAKKYVSMLVQSKKVVDKEKVS